MGTLKYHNANRLSSSKKASSRRASIDRQLRKTVLRFEILEDRRMLACIAEMVEDSIQGGGINPGAASSSISSPTNVNGTLYFNADDGTNGHELWRINSFGVAEMVEDSVPGGGINPGAGDSLPYPVLDVDGTPYFSANDGTNGRELWRINSLGLAEMVEDSIPGGGIRPGAGSSRPEMLTNVNGTLYFQANDGTNGYELWRINSSGRAEMVEDSIPGGGINPAVFGEGLGGLTNVSGTLYFSASDVTNGRELWRINSTGVAEMVEDNVPGGGINPGAMASQPFGLINANGTLYFSADDGTNGRELWRINSFGVAEMVEDSVPGGGINPGAADTDTRYLTVVHGTLYFRADDGTNGYELWRINSAGIAEMVEDTVPGGGIGPGASSSLAHNPYLTDVNGTLYFNADDGTNGRELWRINSFGVAEMVEDSVPGGGINPGASSGLSYNAFLTNVDGTLYFDAWDGTNGRELWRINSSGVAEMVEDTVPGGGINPGDGTSDPIKLTNMDGRLYFDANDGTNGRELWRINNSGIAEMVEDSVPGGGIRPGAALPSYPDYFTNVNGTVYFRANDGANGFELWRINNNGEAPVVGTISAQIAPQTVNTSIFASALFTDADIDDTHTAVWDWGDGTTTAGNVTQSNGSGNVSSTHLYTSAGVYTVTLTVTDSDSCLGKSYYNYVVVYDPAAGFVTGGGWINSPMGAYAANPALTGKANFGFESKYLKGNNVPTGNTEFQFKLANFNFKSTSYEWLVVSGAKARYRGVGTVNGVGNYGFELTAWDGQVNGGGGVDRFRIKIWNNNQGNGVVYDNMMGAADGANPTTALGGGSIVIHTSAQPLLASRGTALASGSGLLTQESLNQAVDQAIKYWQRTGVDASAVSKLRQIHVEVADLSGDELGIASDTNYVWIDRDAAGYGWQLNSLGGIYPAITGGMDLLSVVAHELGHKLGWEHSHDDSDVMAPTLHVGVRTLVGNPGQPLGYFSTNSVLSDHLKLDVVRIISRATTRLLREDSEELQAHDQLLASYDAGPANRTFRNTFVASKHVSDATQKSASASEDPLAEDLMEVIASAHT